MQQFEMWDSKIIMALSDAIMRDEYDDMAQIDARGDNPHTDVDFIRRHWDSRWQEAVNNSTDLVPGGIGVLEIGPGSGRLLPDIVCTHYLEASACMLQRLITRLEKLSKEGKIKGLPIIRQGFAEAIPNDAEWQLLNMVIFMNGFFQVRSDYEALVSINWHLRQGGKFLFNLLSDDKQDIICGRVLGQRNYIRIMREFGFEPLEINYQTGNMAFEKVRHFEPAMLRKLQVVKGEMKNYYEPRDEKYR